MGTVYCGNRGFEVPLKQVILCPTLFLFSKHLPGAGKFRGWQMTLNNQKECLFEPIKDLSLSQEFKLLADSLHYKTLDEMLQVKISILLKKPGFTYHILQELVQFLERKDLANLLKQ